MNLMYPPINIVDKFERVGTALRPSGESSFQSRTKKSISKMRKTLEDFKTKIEKARKPTPVKQTSSKINCVK